MKGTMRFIASLITIAAVILALCVIGVWSYAEIMRAADRERVIPVNSVDILQAILLILGMLFIVVLGKCVQKFAEKGVDNRLVPMRIDEAATKTAPMALPPAAFPRKMP